MPKIGAKPDDRPYNTRCQTCGCLVQKLVDRFNLYGKPARHIYRCTDPYHNCGTVDRDGCTPVRKYGEPVAHAYWDGAGGHWEHPGKAEDCEMPECVDRHSHKTPDGTRHKGRYMDCTSAECEPPFDRGDVATSGDTSWRDGPVRGPWDDWPPADPGPIDPGPEPDPCPDPLAPCPLTGREHRWEWADDGCGHSGDVCMCGAHEE